MHIFHKWGSWVRYDRSFSKWFPYENKTIDCSEYRQYRICSVCRKLQDVKIRDGAKPQNANV